MLNPKKIFPMAQALILGQTQTERPKDKQTDKHPETTTVQSVSML
jgi:hypothetical protein